MAYTVKNISFLVALVVVGGVVANLLPTPPAAAPFPNLRQQFPQYYAVISPNDTSRDRCIVEQGNKLSGFRDDYVKMAVMACDAATNVANRAIEERRERYEAAQRRPR